MSGAVAVEWELCAALTPIVEGMVYHVANVASAIATTT